MYDSASLYTEVESQKEEILKKNHSKIIMSSSEHMLALFLKFSYWF